MSEVTDRDEGGEVFISYSSQDRETIGPIVQLIRVMNDGRVFQDFTSIRPGRRWADEIHEALARCRTIFVFWCEHSAESDWVRREYEACIEAEKEVIPILLDDTNMPDELSAFQGLDFRRKDPHGGLSAFIPAAFRRSGWHFYPKDERGEYRDWEYEEHRERVAERREGWDEAQAERRAEIAAAMIERLGTTA